MNSILVLHGALGSSDDFHGQLDQFMKNGLRPVIPDFPLHGKYPTPWHSGSLDELVEYLHGYLEKTQAKPALVLGYSMGGLVALKYQIQYPDSPFKKIVTYGTKFLWNAQIAQKEGEKISALNLKSRAPDFFKSLEEKHQSINELLSKTQIMMKLLGEQPPLTNLDFAKIKIPTMILRGEQDHMVSADECHKVEELIATSKYIEIPNHKHQLTSVDFNSLFQRVRQ